MGILDAITKTATDAANRAGTKAEELIEVNKLKSQQSSLRDNIASNKRKIGDYCVKLYEDGVELDETLMRFCKEIAKYKEEIAEIDKEIEETKETFRLKQSENDEERLG